MPNKATKVLITTSLLTLTATTFAASTGLYIGLQYGWTNANYGNSAIRRRLKSTNAVAYEFNAGGTGGRINLGYNFMKYAGLEFGYSVLANNTYTATNITKEVYKTRMSDLVAKGYLPLGRLWQPLKNWELFGQAGIARVNASVNVTGNTPSASSGSTYNFVYGGGISYKFYHFLSVNADWLHIKGQGTSANVPGNLKNYSPRSDMIMLGVTYYFNSSHDKI